MIVLGGGSAGFIAALSLKVKLPQLDVRVIRSKDIGIIGVGEGSTIALTQFLHEYLKVQQKKFFAAARPTFKLGLRFTDWGPRPYFNYTFGPTLDKRSDERLPHSTGYYADDDLEYSDVYSAMMTHDRVFERTPGGPRIHGAFSYHFENEKLVGFLEEFAQAVGVKIINDTVAEVRQDESGIAAMSLKSGQQASADLYVDCSGFASMLLGRTLNEPFVSYKSSLFCDRAVVGGWERTSQVIKPYTTCQAMDCGWCWQIEHEARINRGYVHCSDFISEEQAEREFRQKNPAVGPTRIVRFVSGRYQRAWVKNLIAVGNASGFVEPLEATSLGLIALQSRDLTQALLESDGCPRATQVDLYNLGHAQRWDSIRRFIAVHYKFNTRQQTPFWDACREKTDLAGAEPIVEYYHQNGPEPYFSDLLFRSHDQFGYGGYLALLMGQAVPFQRTRELREDEREIWATRKKLNQQAALRAMTVREALDHIHSIR